MNEAFKLPCSRCGKDHMASHFCVVSGIPSLCSPCANGGLGVKKVISVLNDGSQSEIMPEADCDAIVAAVRKAYEPMRRPKIEIDSALLTELDGALRTVDDLRDTLNMASSEAEKRALSACIARILRSIATTLDGVE